MKKSLSAILRAEGFAPSSLLDIGAHVGSFSQQFAADFPDCQCVLVEPNPFCREALSATGFEFHLVAASDQNGKGELFLTREWLQSTGASLYRENTAFFRDEVVMRQSVDKQRIDDLFRGRQFDVVKIDTQGGELDVLRGGQDIVGRARYVLLEISLVNYNEGGAKAEDVFLQMEQMGFRCSEVTEFHRLSGVENGALLQIDVLFENRRASVAATQSGTSPGVSADCMKQCLAVARSLFDQGKWAEALAILRYVNATQPHDSDVVQLLIKAASASGEYLEALDALKDLKLLDREGALALQSIQEQMPGAVEIFNQCLIKGDIEKAEAFADRFASLVPRNGALVNAAMSCNAALGRSERALVFARQLLRLEPGHAGAQSLVNKLTERELACEDERRVALATTKLAGKHPLVQLKELYDVVSELLCKPLNATTLALVQKVVAEAQATQIPPAMGGDLDVWHKHYRLCFEAIDISLVLNPHPEEHKPAPATFVDSSGKTIASAEVKAKAQKNGAEVVFFAAADVSYVQQYGRLYAKSVLKHCDVPALVVLHVIGGADRLRDIAGQLGISDHRLFLSGDDFEAASVEVKCVDTPPKGYIEKPVAHYQSERFLRLSEMLSLFDRPVFVSDIDLLLQRGVGDLLASHVESDLVFNENTGNINPGSRLTANLLLAYPTPLTGRFLRFVRAYLNQALSGPEVSRWIDQFALTMARHHLQWHHNDARIGYFDTESDINNVMYRSFEKNPFRFLSLYHGFDTSTLDDSDEVGDSVVLKGAA